MARKVQSSSDSASDHREVRRRVVKACQRCRLKKCKCDGATPCTRCKSDDAICAYGKHRKSDKIVFRRGYVQMLERQQVQLIAGLQELYNRTQTGVGWTAPPLEPVNYGQPLTHKILDGLGVLRTEEWEDGAVQNGLPRWRSFEEQIQQGNGIINDDDASTEGSPTHTAATSPVPRFQAAFPNSTIMAKRRLKHEVPTTSISQTLDMPSFKPFAYESNTELLRSEPYSQGLPGQISLPIPTLEDNNIEMQQYSGSDNYMGDKPSPFNDNNNDNDSANLNWMSMSDDLLNLPSFQGLLLQVQ